MESDESSNDRMSAAQPQVALLRHIVPVVFGGALTLLLTIVTDNWLIVRGLLPGGGVQAYGTGALAVAAAYRAAFAILGCHMAARLAPAGHPRLRYALALGFVLFVVSVGAASTMWGQTPRWYPLTGVAMSIPCAIIGGATAVRAMVAREAARRAR